MSSNQQFQQQAAAAPFGNTTVLPAKTVVHAPIIQESVRQDKIVEVQPVLHREVDKNVVHHIEKHVQEARAPSMGGVIERGPIVEQQVHTNVVNEIQPVLHRERVVPVAERVEQHFGQRVVEPTVHTHEVVYDGIQGAGLQQQSFQQQNVAQQPHHHGLGGLLHRH